MRIDVWRTHTRLHRGDVKAREVDKLQAEAHRLASGWSDAGLALESLSTVMTARPACLPIACLSLARSLHLRCSHAPAIYHRLSTAEAAYSGMHGVLHEALLAGEAARLEADELKKEAPPPRST